MSGFYVSAMEDDFFLLIKTFLKTHINKLDFYAKQLELKTEAQKNKAQNIFSLFLRCIKYT